MPTCTMYTMYTIHNTLVHTMYRIHCIPCISYIMHEYTLHAMYTIHNTQQHMGQIYQEEYFHKKNYILEIYQQQGPQTPLNGAPQRTDMDSNETSPGGKAQNMGKKLGP